MSFLEENNANNTFTSQKLKHFNNYYNTQLNNERFGEDSSFTQTKNTFQMNNVVSTNMNQYEVTIKQTNNKNEKEKKNQTFPSKRNNIQSHIKKENNNNHLLSQNRTRLKSDSSKTYYNNTFQHPNLEKIVKVLYHTLKERQSDFTDRKNLQQNLSHFELKIFSKFFNSKNKESSKGITSNQIKSYFDGKPRDNMPYILPPTTTYYNDYSSKSEHYRHIKLLEDFNKLRECVNRNKKDAIEYIKDFLIKYHINDIDNYSMEQLTKLTKIAYNNYNVIDPSKTQKDNVKNVLEYKGNLDTSSDTHNTKYISPMLSIKKVKKDDKGKKEILNLYKRANLHLQQKLYVPDKDYAENQQRIIDEVGKELEQYRKERDSEKDVIHRKFNSINNFAFITLCKEKEKATINSKSKSLKDTRVSFRLTSRKSVSEKNSMNSSLYDINSFNINRQEERPSIYDITKRLYYERIEKPKEMDDFRKRNKLTEYIAYNSAKNNQFIRKENKKYCII